MRTDIIHYLETEFSSDQNKLRAAVIHAIIAIGAQCRANGLSDLQCERFHLAKAQKAAFEHMLEHPSIEMVRVFLLLAFYLFGACRRNGAFMYIGVAARAAHCLGLHQDESYKELSESEKLSR